jgi:N-acetylglucosaminyldiphosphoundecaprenol N-acetyl-beta-D-mannosaminyltransferase
MSFNTTPFYNLRVNTIDTAECLTICSAFYESNKSHSLFFINAHCFNIAQKNEAYRKALLEADLILNDGIGIDLAAKINKVKLKENMNGTDLIPKLIEQGFQKNKSIFLIGGVPGIIEQTKAALERKHKGIKIAGTRSGYFSNEENTEIIQQINSSGVELLVIGMGVPRQELWLMENIDKLNTVRLAIGGGAIVDFIAGKVQRAPKWMQKVKLEWFYRFINEPRRLFRRYFIGNFVFFINILKLRKGAKKQQKEILHS